MTSLDIAREKQMLKDSLKKREYKLAKQSLHKPLLSN